MTITYIVTVIEDVLVPVTVAVAVDVVVVHGGWVSMHEHAVLTNDAAWRSRLLRRLDRLAFGAGGVVVVAGRVVVVRVVVRGLVRPWSLFASASRAGTYWLCTEGSARLTETPGTAVTVTVTVGVNWVSVTVVVSRTVEVPVVAVAGHVSRSRGPKSGSTLTSDGSRELRFSDFGSDIGDR